MVYCRSTVDTSAFRRVYEPLVGASALSRVSLDQPVLKMTELVESPYCPTKSL
ncbi:hypothetical protein D3C77_498110 [compost metagenome]